MVRGPTGGEADPGNLPLVVCPSLAKRSLQFGGLALFFVLGGAFEIVAAVADRSRGHTLQFAITAIPMLIGAVVWGAQLYLSFSGGPVLAADHAGLWIKIQADPRPGHLAPAGGHRADLSAPMGGGEESLRQGPRSAGQGQPRRLHRIRREHAAAGVRQRLQCDARLRQPVRQEIMTAIVALSAGRCLVQ
jgi:hypothetical protein